ncbi:MAG: NERD domain-containing protein [Clostridia bacterium]|nr:NERD domain-containing protein [Clostridia bacterium]
MPFLIIGLIVLIIVIAVSSRKGKKDGKPRRRDPDTPEKRAGTRGEVIASNFIARALDEDDWLFKNVEIIYDGRETELDDVVVNRYGVFIIEVKNLTGEIVGNEDDAEWMKYKTTKRGVTYEKSVPNPLRQVNREIFLLKSYLEEQGVNVWVEGYVFFVQGNCPITGERVLEDLDDIKTTVHTPVKRAPGQKKAERIAEILEKCKA